MHPFGLRLALTKDEVQILNDLFGHLMDGKKAWESNDLEMAVKHSHSQDWVNFHDSNRRINVLVNQEKKTAVFEEEIYEENTSTPIITIRGQTSCSRLTISSISRHANGNISLHLAIAPGTRLAISQCIHGFEHTPFQSALHHHDTQSNPISSIKLILSPRHIESLHAPIASSTIGPSAMGLSSSDPTLQTLNAAILRLKLRMDDLNRSKPLTYNNMRVALAAAARAESELEKCGTHALSSSSDQNSENDVEADVEDEVEHWIEVRRIAIGDYNALGNVAVWERRIACLSEEREKYVIAHGLR